MKMRSFFRMGVLLTAICLTAAGCGKDDKTPEQLPDPLDTTTEYYLVGVVSSAEGVVKGAEVKITDDIKATTDAQGKYNLTLSKTGDYTVTVKASKLEDFSTKVNIASSAKKRSTLTLNVQMSKVVEYTAPKEAVSGQETKVEVPAATETETPAAIVTAPANAMDEGVKISAGAYEEPKANVSAPVTSEKKEVEPGGSKQHCHQGRTGKCHCQERYRHCYAKPKCKCFHLFRPGQHGGSEGCYSHQSMGGPEYGSEVQQRKL